MNVMYCVQLVHTKTHVLRVEIMSYLRIQCHGVSVMCHSMVIRREAVQFGKFCDESKKKYFQKVSEIFICAF